MVHLLDEWRFVLDDEKADRLIVPRSQCAREGDRAVSLIHLPERHGCSGRFDSQFVPREEGHLLEGGLIPETTDDQITLGGRLTVEILAGMDRRSLDLDHTL